MSATLRRPGDPGDPVGIDELRAAAARIAGTALVTPLLESPHLNALAGRRVLVKAECLQRTGSFKFRGAWNALSSMDPETRTRGVLAYSSGNHAQGIAHAGHLLGIATTVVMPADAPALKLANTRALGGTVVTYDRAGGESREALGDALAAERGLTLVRPYDEPAVIAGQGTCGLEIARQAREAGVERGEVLVCCGGGGLAAGIALALEADAPGLRVRPVEPAAADDTLRSLVAGERLPVVGTPDTICDAIVTPMPGALTFPVLRRLAGPGLAVGDHEVLRAMRVALERLKIVLEPGGAVALAAVLGGAGGPDGQPVICVASGGNVDASVLGRALAAD